MNFKERIMNFSKLLNVKNPERGTEFSAGIDFFIPEESDLFLEKLKQKNPGINLNNEGFIIEPHGRVLIPSGIKVQIPDNTALIAFNKSGVATKLGLDVGASVIDSDYQGEIHISLTNPTSERVVLSFGQKIIQFLLLPIILTNPKEIPEKDLYDFKTQRSSGGFGSTGSF